MSEHINKTHINIQCYKTDFHNPRLIGATETLAGILLGIGVGTGAAKLLNLQIPNIALVIAIPNIALVIAGVIVTAALLYCGKQIIATPSIVTLIPDAKDFIDFSNESVIWKFTDDTEGESGSTLVFDKKYSVVKQENNGSVQYVFSGKPHADLVSLTRKAVKENHADHFYLFREVSLVLSPSIETEKIIQGRMRIRQDKEVTPK